MVPYGVNSNKFKPAIDKKLDEVHYSPVFCGSFLPHKGIDLLPQIFSRLIGSYPNLKLNIIGSGSWQEKIQAEFTLLGINDSIYWHGYLP